jgi:hypothetical protein
MGPTNKSNGCLRRKKIDNMTLIWLDKRIGRTDENYYSMKRFCDLFNNIRTFNRIDSFIDYLYNEVNEAIILVVSGSFGSQIIPKIHLFNLIDSIYIFCENKTKHQLWAKDFHKIHGVYNDIDLLCLYLRKTKLFQPNDEYHSIKKKSSSNQSSPLQYIECLIQPDHSNEQVKNEFMSYYSENQAQPVSDIIDRDSCHNKNENIDSFLIYFCDDKVRKVDMDNDVAQSNTVIPFIQQKDQPNIDNGKFIYYIKLVYQILLI